MDFKKLRNDGYFLRIQKGTFKNKHHTEFSVCKNLSEDGRRKKIACLVNLATFRILKNEWLFKAIEDDKETIWLNEPESYNGFHTQTKEPLKITWHN